MFENHGSRERAYASVIKVNPVLIPKTVWDSVTTIPLKYFSEGGDAYQHMSSQEDEGN